MGLPESPTALQAVNITRNSVQLTWQSPFVDAALQSAVIGYRLEYYTPSTATGKCCNSTSETEDLNKSKHTLLSPLIYYGNHGTSSVHL